MNSTNRLAACIPYVACLVLAAILWALTGQITYDARPGQLGPTFWPQAAIALMAVAAIAEIARRGFSRDVSKEISGLEETLESGEGDGAEDAPRLPHLLLGGVALTIGYGFVVTTIGFILSTFIFLVAFMYLGRYRNHVAIWTSSLIGTLLFTIIFLKVVYISLPRGTPPFDSLTQGVLDLLGWF